MNSGPHPDTTSGKLTSKSARGADASRSSSQLFDGAPDAAVHQVTEGAPDTGRTDSGEGP
jgi:hypothetical protein